MAGLTDWHNIYAYLVKYRFPQEDPSMQQIATRTLVTFLLDRTGSMEAIRDDMIGGFNAYLDGLKGNGGTDIDFTLIQFDSVSIDKICGGSGGRDGEAHARDLSAARLHAVDRRRGEDHQRGRGVAALDACSQSRDLHPDRRPGEFLDRAQLGPR